MTAGGDRGVEVVRLDRAVAADARPEVLAVLSAVRGPAEESTFRRAFALLSPDVLDQVLGTWLHTRVVQADGRLAIAIGNTVRGAKNKHGKGPHLVAALAHTQHYTAQAIITRGADYVMTVKANMPTLYQQLKKLPWARRPSLQSAAPGRPGQHRGRQPPPRP